MKGLTLGQYSSDLLDPLKMNDIRKSSPCIRSMCHRNFTRCGNTRTSKN